MKRYGALMARRKLRWRVGFPGEGHSEWHAERQDVERLAVAWKAKAVSEWKTDAGKRQKRTEEDRAKALEDALEQNQRDHEAFLAETEINLVTVANPNVFESDFRKLVVKFPDGSELLFEDGAEDEEINRHIEAVALEAHPLPTRDESEIEIGEPMVPEPEIESSEAWGLDFLATGHSRSFPDIENWTYSFPVEGVMDILNELAGEGWSIEHVSEDRGLYGSEMAERVSAPLLVRYLLVCDES